MEKQKQIEEMVNVPTKEEQIARAKRAKEREELAQALYHYANKELTYGIKNSVDCLCCASYLIEDENYRKIPENAVVLTREEHEALLLEQKRLREMVDRIPCGYELKDKTRKETARAILGELWNNKIEAIITIQNNCSKEDVENIGKTILLSIRNKLKEIAEQYGVEVEE